MRTLLPTASCRGDVRCGEDDRARAVAHGRDVEQPDRIGDDARARVCFEVERLVQQRIRIREGVLMRRDGERREALGRHAVSVHVRAHQRCIQRQERFAADAFELPVRRRGERAGDGIALDVRHALDAANGDGIVNAARDGLVSDADRGAPRGTRGFDGHCFDSREPGVVGDQPAELLLLGKDAGEHVADVERADSLGLDAGIGKGRLDRRGAEMAAASLWVLRDRRLTHAGDEHVSQPLLRSDLIGAHDGKRLRRMPTASLRPRPRSGRRIGYDAGRAAKGAGR